MHKRVSQLRASQTPVSGTRTPTTTTTWSGRQVTSSYTNNVTPVSAPSKRTRGSVAKAHPIQTDTGKTGKTLQGALARLVSQLKKRDSYAFFLEPVDTKQVFGYADVIKKPMDLGTMSTKVDKDKYRSMDQFRNDFLLVTGNAKTFNPPTTIFHTEAVKLEKWGLDAIIRTEAKLAEAESLVQAHAEAYSQRMEVDNDVDEHIKVESDGDDSGHLDRGRSGSLGRGSRSMSANPITSMKVGKRRGGYRPRGVPKSLDELLKIPGPESGVGAFPHGSDLAGVMIELESMGKKVLTKKERAKLERQPLKMPVAPDGTIDYMEMEDPFSVLSLLLPDEFAGPQLELVPPPTGVKPSKASSSTAPYTGTYPSIPVPPTIVSKRSLAGDEPAALLKSDGKGIGFSVQRPGSTGYRRTLAAEEDEMRKKDEQRETIQKEKDTREPAPVDWGSFGTMPMIWAPGDAMWYGDEGKIQARIRDESRRATQFVRRDKTKGLLTEGERAEQDALEGESWLRDTVYGGPDGATYVKSLASFVARAQKYAGAGTAEASASSAEAINAEEDESSHKSLKLKRETNVADRIGLGMPLAEYVQNTVIDPLTNAMHDMLQSMGGALESPPQPLPKHLAHLAAPLRTSLNTFPAARRNLAEVTAISKAAVDMGAVLRTPKEFFFRDEEWADRPSKRAKMEAPPQSSTASFTARPKQDSEAYLNFALAKAATAIVDFSNSQSRPPYTDPSSGLVLPSRETGNEDDEDPALRKLRLNLLTMTRHVPLAELAPLNPALIPEHVRHLFPAQMTAGKQP